MKLTTQPTIRDTRHWGWNEQAARESRRSERVRLRAKSTVKVIFGATILSISEGATTPNEVKAKVLIKLESAGRPISQMSTEEALAVLGLD